MVNRPDVWAVAAMEIAKKAKAMRNLRIMKCVWFYYANIALFGRLWGTMRVNDDNEFADGIFL